MEMREDTQIQRRTFRNPLSAVCGARKIKRFQVEMPELPLPPLQQLFTALLLPLLPLLPQFTSTLIRDGVRRILVKTYSFH